MHDNQKHYLNHLAEINKENKVELSDDILNNKGVLVVRKHSELNQKLAEKIAKHKLIKPLEQSIKLSRSLTYNGIIDIYKKRLANIGLLQLSVKNSQFLDAVSQVKAVFKYPLVVQKLTVFANRMPDAFASSLVTSILSYVVCKSLRLSAKQSENVFLANLLSNIGMLHIDPKVVNKKGKYSPKEWMLMQGHVAISKHFVDHVPGMPKIVARAILEHHERADGFGYPLEKQADSLCIEGQVISVIDKANALYKKLVKYGPYSWPCVTALMRLPTTEHTLEVQNAILRVLLSFGFEHKPAFTNDKYFDLIARCIEKRKRLRLWFDEFEKIYVVHGSKLKETKNFKPAQLLEMLRYTATDSGILIESQHQWLLSLHGELSDSECFDIEEFWLILDEFEYQCSFVLRQFVLAKSDLEKMFGSLDIPKLYFEGLKGILQ